MKKWMLLILTVMGINVVKAQDVQKITDLIIGMEKAALDRWGQGDPGGFLEISAPDVVYFDPFVEQRLNGIGQLTDLYESLRGKVHIDKYELVEPKVQVSEKMVVLTFNFIGYAGNEIHRWNCTEVYRKEVDGQWKIIQTHWSLVRPQLK